MAYYPIYLDLKEQTVLMIGAGKVAWQKIPALLNSEARIRVVAPEALAAIQELAQVNKLEWIQRPYRSTDLDHVRLVIVATDDPDLQKKVAAEARARHIWVNVVDVPALCNFIAPAVIGRGDIQIAISTGGAAPAIAKYLRRQLEPLIGPEYEALIRVLKELRPAILKLPQPQRRSFWERVTSDSFVEDVRTGGISVAETRLREWLHGN